MPPRPLRVLPLATLVVACGPPAATITAELSAATSPAGEEVAVTCSATDDKGEPLDEVTFELEVGEGLEALQGSVRGLTAGSWEVRCLPLGDVEELASIPATLEVTAGPATTLSVTQTPQQDYYAPGDVVTLGVEAADAYGNIADVTLDDVTITTSPEGAAEVGDGGRIELLREAILTVDVVAASDAGELTRSVELIVDGSVPDLTITTPEPGLMVDGAERVEIRGRVFDTISGVGTLEVDGREIVVDSDGTFVAMVEPEHGLRVVEVRATDRSGRSTRASVAWLQSDGWTPLMAEAESPAGSGFLFRLGVDALHDGTVEAYGSDDLAQAWLAEPRGTGEAELTGPTVESRVLEQGLAKREYKCSEPWLWQVRGEDAQIFARVTAVEPLLHAEGDTLELVPTEGGLDLSWSGQLRLSYTVKVRSKTKYRGSVVSGLPSSPTCTNYLEWYDFILNWTTVRQTVDLPVSVKARAELDLSPGADSRGTLTLTEVDVPVLDLPPELASEPVRLGKAKHTLSGLNYYPLAWTTLGEMFPSGQHEDLVVDLLVREELDLEDRLEDYLSGRLQSMALGLSQDRAAPGVLGPAETAAVARMQVTQSTVDPDGLVLGTLAGIESVAVRDPGLGAIVRGDCLGATDPASAALEGATDVGVAVPVDQLNLGLHASWAASDAPVVLPPESWQDEVPEGADVVAITLERPLPAVTSDCTGEVAVRAVGRARLDMDEDGVAVAYTLDVEASAGLSLDADLDGFALRTLTPEATVVGGRERLPAETRDALVALVERLSAAPLLDDPVREAGSLLPSPTVPLGTIADDGIELRAVGSFTAKDGYFLLDTCEDAACTAYASTCDGDRVVECTPTSATCSTWAPVEDCAETGGTCTEDLGVATCSDGG